MQSSAVAQECGPVSAGQQKVRRYKDLPVLTATFLSGTLRPSCSPHP